MTSLRSFARLLALPLAAVTLSMASSVVFAKAKSGVEPISLYSPAQRSDKLDNCLHLFPSGQPVPMSNFRADFDLKGLCSDQFAVIHSGVTKSPLVVVERVTREMIAAGKGMERSDNFYPDPRVGSNKKAFPVDFSRSGYDRGHLAPAANAATEQAMQQSFSMSNMIAQAPQNNRRTWNKLEQDTRKYVLRASGPVYIYSGPLFPAAGPSETIGRNKVWVPSKLFKLVYHPESKKAWAHVLDNTDEATIGKPMSYPEFVRMTRLQLIPELSANQ